MRTEFSYMVILVTVVALVSSMNIITIRLPIIPSAPTSKVVSIGPVRLLLRIGFTEKLVTGKKPIGLRFLAATLI